MEPTLVIGIAIVVIGTALAALMMFGQRANPLAESNATLSTSLGTIPPSSETTSGELGQSSGNYPGSSSGASRHRAKSTSRAQSSAKSIDGGGVKVRWYQRLRSLIVLLLITIGLGMAAGAAIGAVALGISLFLG